MFFWLHSHVLSRSFTPHSVPVHSHMSSLPPFPTALPPPRAKKKEKKNTPLSNQDNISQVLWELVLMATMYLPFLFFSSGTCSGYIYCLGQWPSKAKPLLVPAKGKTGGQQYPCPGCQCPIRKVLSSNAAEASATVSQGATKAGTEAADILQ